MKRWGKALTQLAVVLLILAVIGAIASADERPRLRVVHAASGLPNIDVYVNEILYFNNVPYPYISDYTPVDSGDRTVRIRPSGVSSEGPTLRPEVTQPFSDDREYTVILAGRVKEIEYWRLEDDNQLPGDGTAKVRIVHASFSTPTAEFCIGDVCRTLAFKESSDYFLLDPGVYYPKIQLNGLEATTISIPPLKLKNNSVHTVFMVGQLQDKPTALQLLYTLDNLDEVIYPQPLPPGVQAKPLPEKTHPDVSVVPPPQYPPVTGAFLSPRLLGIVAAVSLIVLGSFGFWLAQR